MLPGGGGNLKKISLNWSKTDKQYYNEVMAVIRDAGEVHSPILP